MTATAGTNLDRTLHKWWVDTPALESLLPASHVISGEWQDDNVPSTYVTINTTSEPALNTNSGIVHLGNVEVACRSSSYEHAKAVAETIRDSWNRQTRDDDEIKITSMRYTETQAEQDEDAFWFFSVMFEARYSELI